MKDKIEITLTGIAFLPIFFGDDFLLITSVPSGNFAVPISILALFILILINILKVRFLVNILDVHVLFIIIYMMLAYFLVGFLLHNSNPNFLLLYSVPILIGYTAGRLSRLDLRSFIKIYVFAMAGYSFLHIADSVYQFGVFDAIKNQGSDAVLNIFYIYGKYIYFPLMLSLALFFVSTGVLKEFGNFKYVLGALIIFELIILAAREPFVIVFLMYLIYKLRAKELKKIAYLVGCVFISIAILIVIADDFPLVEKISNLGHNPSAGRLDQLLYFMEYIHDINFFIGESYSDMLTNPEGSFHNQWIDFYVKGGMIMLVLNIAFFLRFSLALNLYRGKHKQIISMIFVMLMVIFLIEFQINTSMRAPYSATILWFIIGIHSREIYKEF